MSRTSCATGLADLAAEQRAADGMVSFVVPDVLKYVENPSHFPAPESTAIWSDAAVWVPWALWQAYGDLAGAERSVRLDDGARSACGITALAHRTVGYRVPIRRLAGSDRTSRRSDQQQSRQRRRGDRLPLPRRSEFLPRPPTCLDAARMPQHFAELAERTKTAFNDHYVNDDGTIHSDAQTVYALAIVFGLLDRRDSSSWRESG